MPKDNTGFFLKKSTWSIVKDQLLEGYLPQYFQKVLATHRPVFYVDCFAGKGKFEDGKDGSPRIALKVRDDCLRHTTFSDGKIDMCFIELNHAKELQQNISDYHQNGSPMVISGKYEEQIVGLLTSKKHYNVFLYIDPYGIKALDYRLFNKFSSFGFGSIEMLINVNTFGFFRDACRVLRVDKVQLDEAFSDLDDFIVEYAPTKVDDSEHSKTLLSEIAGGDYWVDIVREYQENRIDGYQAEMRFSTEYKQQLKRIFKYVLDIPIRIKPNQCPKYRMVHVSNHEDGCILMANNMAARKDELFIDIQNKGQLSFLIQTSENEIIGIEEIYCKVEAYLQNNKENIRLNALLASFFTDCGVICKSGDLIEILRMMERSGKIQVNRYPSTTEKTGKPSTFFSERNGKSVIIRWGSS